MIEALDKPLQHDLADAWDRRDCQAVLRIYDEHLDRDDADTVAATIHVLMRRFPEEEPVRAWVAQFHAHPGPVVRRAVCSALAKRPLAADVDVFAAHLDDPDEATCRWAAFGLADLPGGVSPDVMLRGSASFDWLVRRTMVSAFDLSDTSLQARARDMAARDSSRRVRRAARRMLREVPPGAPQRTILQAVVTFLIALVLLAVVTVLDLPSTASVLAVMLAVLVAAIAGRVLVRRMSNQVLRRRERDAPR